MSTHRPQSLVLTLALLLAPILAAAAGRAVPVDASGQPVLRPDGTRILYGPGHHPARARASLPGALTVLPPAPSVVDPALLRPDFTIGSQNQLVATTGMYPVDVDGDGVPELLVGHSQMWYLLAFDPARGGYAQLHFHEAGLGSTFGGGDIVELRPGDADGDGVVDVVLLYADGSIGVNDARSGVETARYPLALASPAALAVGDYDAAPGDEVAVLSAGSLWVYHLGTPGALWTLPTGGTGIASGNVDADPATEIVVSGVIPGPVIDTGLRAVEWTFPAGFGIYVAVGNLDGDPMAEIAAAEGWGDIWTVDGDTRTEKWRTPNPDDDNDSVAIADSDGDGVGEVLVGDGQWGNARVFDGPTGLERVAIPNPEHGIPNLTAGDFDGDCEFEVAWGAGYTSTGGDGVFIGSMRTRQVEWRSLETDGPMFGLQVGDADGDGWTDVLHLSQLSDAGYEGPILVITDLHHRRTKYASPALTSGFDANRGLGLAQLDGDPALEYVVGRPPSFGDGVSAMDGATHQVQWSIVLDDGETSAIATGDVDNDGSLEALIGTRTLRILRGSDGGVLWRSAAPPTGQIGDIRVADVDGDSASEVVYIDGTSGVRVLDGATRVEEWFLPSTSIRALDVGDVDHDGDLDIVIGGSNGVIAGYDGLTHALVYNLTPVNQPIHAVRMADVDGDGVQEVVFSQGLAANTSALKVLEPSTSSVLWTSSPMVGNAGTSSSLVVADADDDGKREILVGSAYAVHVFEYAGTGVDSTPPVWVPRAGAAAAVAISSEVCCPSVDVSWNDARDGSSPPVAYAVYRGDQSGFVPDASNLVGTTLATSYRDPDVQPATRYYYVVRAADRQGNAESNSNEVTVLTTDPAPPPAPTSVTVTDLDPCAPSGVEVRFSYTGDVSLVTFDLIRDGTPLGTSIGSPYIFVPPDRLTHQYQVRARKIACPVEAVSTTVAAADLGSTLARPTIASVMDRDICATSGVRITFTHAGFATPGHYDLVVDGAVVASPVTSPVDYSPVDAASHSYVVRAVEPACSRTSDSTARSAADANRIPAEPVVDPLEDADACAAGATNLRFTHPGFPELGHYELWRDGAPFASPVVNGSLFTPGDAADHVYRVRAVDDRCGLQTDSAEQHFADSVSCAPLDEPVLYAVKLGPDDVRFEWTAASGPVAAYNLYPGDLPALRATRLYTHQKSLAGATFPDAPDPALGCDVASGPQTTARLVGAPGGLPLYFLVVAANAAGMEGPYGRCAGGLDCHDPTIDPRPASFFCP